MKRYLTTEEPDGDIHAYTETDDWTAAIDRSHCWVWQRARDAEAAISQHLEKFAQWENDIARGRKERTTY